ncbi:NgoMIV family type II restriction endonuclease [Paenarthrobacter sp. NPDC089714]|uniref:NgoMIV family type II restriction endonuclease n=1 Tax=Paenarthrobacter sp. NPDC089714 TaxID=3364377 RepID=UPI003820E9C8
MPAPFAASLCGFRPKNGNPNTSDNNDKGSIELGLALFEEMGVPEGQVVGDDPGANMEIAIVNDLQPHRSDLLIRRGPSALAFEQYAHLRVFPEFRRGHQDVMPHVEHLMRLASALPSSGPVDQLRTAIADAEEVFRGQDRMSERLKLYMPEESLLNLDITCASEQEAMEPILHLGLSSKWSLRTDRAQDCVSQGSKLASQRRGPMPHYAVITMEPRPAMLKILADGSGSVDYVYHLDLPALKRAMKKVRAQRRSNKWSPGDTFDRLLNQGRIRDYDQLVDAVKNIPKGLRPSVPEHAAEQVPPPHDSGSVGLTALS